MEDKTIIGFNEYRFETAWTLNKISPWCNLFSPSDLEVFEYKEDLQYYYSEGYAKSVTTDMTQPLWSDLFERQDTICMIPHYQMSFPFLYSITNEGPKISQTKTGPKA